MLLLSSRHRRSVLALVTFFFFVVVVVTGSPRFSRASRDADMAAENVRQEIDCSKTMGWRRTGWVDRDIAPEQLLVLLQERHDARSFSSDCARRSTVCVSTVHGFGVLAFWDESRERKEHFILYFDAVQSNYVHFDLVPETVDAEPSTKVRSPRP
jgi:hypothetical protein